MSLVIAIVVALAIVVPAAAAAKKFVDGFFGGTAGPGTAGGQFNQPRGVAVNDAGTAMRTGEIYVVDEGNNRIQRFRPAGRV